MQINLGARKIHCKIVYYGPGCSGKTTNIQKVHQHMPKERKSSLTSIATEGDRTLFFDFMSLDLGKVMGMDTSFQLYTVPGQVYYNATRKLVLQGVDGLVFVADCSPDRFEANVESWQNLIENLAEYRLTLDDVPVVIQYNKRDVPGAVATERLNAVINQKGFKTFESVASAGQGVLETLKAMCSLVIAKLSAKAASERAAAKSMTTKQTAHSSSEHITRPAASAASTATVDPPATMPTQFAPAASARPEGIAMVSLDYSVKSKPPESKPRPSVTDKRAGSSATTATNAMRNQYSHGRPSAVVKPTGYKVVIGRIQPKRSGSRAIWMVILGGLATAAAVAGVLLYLGKF